MPGIHVRSLGRYNWEEQNKESVLTVPGSYWLCYKNNIYKFTFKFHKSIRKTTNFAYSKELMKIIRRVIKHQPKQGQHFSTTNLLVTYNHASWTRQDKAFAVMKFCDRPDASAFPHAFILTVNILDQKKQSKIKGEMGGKAAKLDFDKSTTSSNDKNSTSSSKNLIQNQENANKTVINTGQREKENRSSRTRSQLRDIPDFPTTTNVTSRCITLLGSEDYDEDDDDVVTNPRVEVYCDSLLKSIETPSILNEQKIMEKSKTFITEDDSDSNSDSQSDSASLPYQYLIEKDIERELEHSRLAELQNSLKEKVTDEMNTCETGSAIIDDSMPVFHPENNDCSSKDQKINDNGKFRSRQNSKDSDSLPPPAVANLKSSNITDLVMKGLMFTIRQDKDAVTVVEQKTKLELDEVLENSEKVETTAGDPCLLNSSLLRLEKMITRMREPICHSVENNDVQNPLVTYVDQCNMEIDSDDFEQRIQKDKTLDAIKINKNEFDDDVFEKIDTNSNSCFSREKKDEDSFIDSCITDQCNMEIDSNFVQHIEKNDNDKLNFSWRHIYDDDEDIQNLSDKKFNKKSLETSSCMKFVSSDDEIEVRFSEIEDVVQESILNGTINSMSKLLTSNNSVTEEQSNCFTLKNDGSNNNLPRVISNKIVKKNELSPQLQQILFQNQIANKNFQSTTTTSTTNNELVLNESDFDVHSDNNYNAVDKLSSNELYTTIKDNLEIKETNFDKNCSVNTTNDTNKEKSLLILSENEKKFVSKKVIENSNSNSYSEDGIRKTRSNSKSWSGNNEFVSNDNLLRLERQIKTRSQKNNQSNINSLQQKRKNNTNGKIVSKVYKTDVNEQDTNINVIKLLNDLKYGVEVVVERLDISKVTK